MHQAASTGAPPPVCAARWTWLGAGQLHMSEGPGVGAVDDSVGPESSVPGFGVIEGTGFGAEDGTVVASLTFGDEDDEITDAEVERRMAAEMEKVRQMSDVELGAEFEAGSDDIESDEEFTLLLEGPQVEAKVDMGENLKRLWNNYIGVLDKVDATVTVAQEELKAVQVLSAAATEAAADASKVLAESKRKSEAAAIKIERVAEKVASAVAADSGDSGAVSSPGGGANNAGDDSPPSKRPAEAAAKQAADEKKKSLDAWLARREQQQLRPAAERRAKRARSRERRRKESEAELRRAREAREAEERRLEEARKLRKLQQDRARREMERRLREAEDMRRQREALEQEQRRLDRGRKERTRLRAEDERSRAVREYLRTQQRVRAQAARRCMAVADAAGRERQEQERRARMRAKAATERVRMARADAESAKFSLSECARVARERAAAWAARMRGEDRRSGLVMQAERLVAAEREARRLRNLAILRKRKERLRRERVLWLMSKEDARSRDVAKRIQAQQRARASSARARMRIEDRRSFQAGRVRRLCRERSGMAKEDARGWAVFTAARRRRATRAARVRACMAREDAACAVWNSRRNRRFARDCGGFAAEDARARRVAAWRTQRDRVGFAREDKRAREILVAKLAAVARAHAAATRIQALWRGYRSRKTQPYRQEIQARMRAWWQRRHEAATRIQALWRGIRLRRKLRAIRERILLGLDEEDDGFDYGGITDDFLPDIGPLPEISDVYEEVQREFTEGGDVVGGSDIVGGDAVGGDAVGGDAMDGDAKAEKRGSFDKTTVSAVPCDDDDSDMSPLEPIEPLVEHTLAPLRGLEDLEAPVLAPPVVAKAQSRAAKPAGGRAAQRLLAGQPGRMDAPRPPKASISKKQKLQKLADEWGLTDLKAAEAMLKRQKRWKRLSQKGKKKGKYAGLKARVRTHVRRTARSKPPPDLGRSQAAASPLRGSREESAPPRSAPHGALRPLSRGRGGVPLPGARAPKSGLELRRLFDAQKGGAAPQGPVGGALAAARMLNGRTTPSSQDQTPKQHRLGGRRRGRGSARDRKYRR